MTLDELFEDFKKKIDRDFLAGKDKESFLKQLARIRERYATIQNLNQESNIAVGLIERGSKIMKSGPLKPDAVKALLRYAKAAWYDMSGNLSAYTWYVRCFFAASIAFFIIAPQFFGPILPLIFIVPVFVGLKGLKSRSMMGFTLSALVYPMSLMACSNAARTYVGAILWNMAEFVATQSVAYGISAEMTQALVYVFAPISLVGIIASVAGAVVGIMHREMFV